MALKAIQPYHDICDVSFSIARIAHSPRKRSHIDSERNAAMNDAIGVACHIFYQVHKNSTVPGEIRNLLHAQLNAHFGVSLFRICEIDERSLPDFFRPIVDPGVQVMIKYKDDFTLTEQFISLIHAATIGKGMMGVLDSIADSIRLEYLDNLTCVQLSSSWMQGGGPGEISAESETNDREDDDPLNQTNLNSGGLPWPWDENGNLIPSAKKETIQFSINPETPLKHVIEIHYSDTDNTPVMGVIPDGYVRRQNTHRSTNVENSIGQEASSQSSQRNDEQVDNENVSVSNENDSTQLETGRQSVESDSNHVVLNITENGAGTQAEQRSGTEAPPGDTTTLNDAIIRDLLNLELPDGVRSGIIDVTDLIRARLDQTMNNPIPSNSSHPSRRRAAESDSLPPNSTAPGSISRRAVPSNLNQTPSNLNRNSSNPSDATTEPELVRPWTKLVAVLNPSEPVPIDSGLVFTYKHLQKTNGHVEETGLISGLVGHDEALKLAKVKERLDRLDHDQVGASVQLHWTFRFGAFLYLAFTFVLAIVTAAINVGKRNSWYSQTTDFISILTTCWVTVFGFVKLATDDPDVLRNLALGKRVFRTPEQVYGYTGDAGNPAGASVKTVIAMYGGKLPWDSEVDKSSVRSALIGKIDLRNGLSTSECHKGGWVFGHGMAYNIYRARSYKTTFENGLHTIDMGMSFGFPGLQNLILHHFKRTVFVY